MNIKKYISGDIARTKLFNGMKIVSDAVGSTCGAGGRTIAIQQAYGKPKITKDGISVAKEIILNNEEGEGAKMIIQASEKTAKSAGDGTTATCLLSSKIAENGLKYLDRGCNVTALKKGIEQATKDVVDELKKHSITVTTNDEIKQIASVSANGDEQIGSLIAEAIGKVGKNGIITVEEAKGLNTTLEVVEGLSFEQGYLSPYFITNLDKTTVEYDNPLLFLYDGKINSINSILPLLEEVAKMNRPIIFIVDEMDDTVLGALIQNRLRGYLSSCVVKAPSFGDMRRDILSDIAVLTNGQFISSLLGDNLEKLSTKVLGTCEKIKITATQTVIINGKGDPSAIQERIDQLKSEIANSESEYDISKYKERLAKLSNGIGIIKVGGATEVELGETKDRVEDAVCATKAAIEEGILPGGGISLLRAHECLYNNIDKYRKEKSDDFSLGYKILLDSLYAPIEKIVENAGDSSSVVIEKVSNKGDDDKEYSFGYNVVTQEYGNMVNMGIVDATKVVRCSIENASSVASSLLTVEGLIIDDYEENLKYKKLNSIMNNV